MTLLARNEADIVDAQVAFHLHAGVDFVVATDNGSDDGTTEVLERYERAGVLHLLREDADGIRQAEWVTRMARLAASDFGADWVLNSDADEFWLPRGGTLKQVLGLVPERFGVLRCPWRHFLMRPSGAAFFAERMTLRLRVPAHPGDKRTVYHAHQKVAHRATADVVLEPGNHNAHGTGLEPLRTWFPIEVLHFSFRSPEQMESKARGGWVGGTAPLVEHQLELESARRERKIDALFGSFAVGDAAAQRGLADGTLAVDTRLRDRLREIRTADGAFAPPASGATFSFPPPSVDDAAAYAAEVAVLAQIDGIVRAEQRVARLEARLGALRTLPRR
jgi:hypothetical protein